MRLVVADTGPLNYLVLIGTIDILPRLFESILVPERVCAELRHPAAPAAVRAWAIAPPAWIDIRAVSDTVENDPSLETLDDGERAALALARDTRADLILIDDRGAVAIAHRQGFAVTGTLGLLDLAARRGMIDLADAFTRLKATNFRYRPEIMDAVLADHRSRDRNT